MFLGPRLILVWFLKRYFLSSKKFFFTTLADPNPRPQFLQIFLRPSFTETFSLNHNALKFYPIEEVAQNKNIYLLSIVGSLEHRYSVTFYTKFPRIHIKCLSAQSFATNYNFHSLRYLRLENCLLY